MTLLNIGADEQRQHVEAKANALAKKRKLTKTLREEGEEELLSAIEESPTDTSRWLVYADWLIERGDVRVEMIVRDISIESGQEGIGKLGDALARTRVSDLGAIGALD